MDNNILNSTYIGHIKKNHKGGIRIIHDSEDKDILKKRDFILNELSNIFKGGKELMYEDIPYYVQALEGKYIRNKMCKGGNPKCTEACHIVKKSYNHLIKKSLKEFNNPELLNIIKGGSPYLYKKVIIKKSESKNKLNGGIIDNSDQNGGNTNDILLDILRLEINEIRG